jgi:hypothetical protein
MNSKTALKEINQAIKLKFPEVERPLELEFEKDILVSIDSKEKSVSFDVLTYSMYTRYLDEIRFIEKPKFTSNQSIFLASAKIRTVLIGKNKDIYQLGHKLVQMLNNIKINNITAIKLKEVKTMHDVLIKEEFVLKENDLFKDAKTGIGAIDYEIEFYFDCNDENCI